MQRILNPALKAFLDSKLSCATFDKAGIINPAVLMVLAANGCLEVTGEPHDTGPMVDLFQSTVSSAHGQPWCMDFVQSIVCYIETLRGLKSPLIASEWVLGCWQKTPMTNRVISPAFPMPGDIILWQFGDTGEGHCGILTGGDPLKGTWNTIEGNTEAQDAIVRQGDGVYARVRPRGGAGSFRELGFIRPFLAP